MKNKIITRTILFFIITLGLFLSSITSIRACTYDVFINGTHIDIYMRSYDVAVVQYIRQSGDALVTKAEAPDIGKKWNYTDDPYCNIWSVGTWACRQSRSDRPGGLGNGFFFADDLDTVHFSPLSNQSYGLDFNITPTRESIGIMDGTWRYCTVAGITTTPTPSPIPSSTPISTPTPSPIPTLSPTLTPTPIPTSTPTPTPTATATPTTLPTITPSPTSSHVSKVFFVPGIGATWNLDAFASCKTSGYSGNWTLNPIGQQVYQTILDTISSSGWTVKPFYYDWRQNVNVTASLLSNYINSNTFSNEKIDLVGHSMGGLIGRAYLESDQGKHLAKFLAVGSPFQGSDLAYPIWSGGDVWINDTIQKIAVDLYLGHCGGIFSNNRQAVQIQVPSIQGLLPSVDYIKNSQSNAVKSVNTMSAKSNYFPATLPTEFWGVKVGTITGTGFPTINMIDVVNPSKSDTNQGNWLDGKPVNKEYTNQGDGTVLTASSQIPGAINKTINQNHSGLVASTDGMSEIIKFLGYPNSLADPPYVGPKSALVIVGYPGNFWITDKNGVMTQSDNGMIGLLNPQDGNYQLQIVPTSTSTTLIIYQSLSNGQTGYKEYHLKGLNQSPKIIEFNSRHLQADVFHEATDYKTPIFPKFWVEFWKIWNKFHK